MKPTDFNFKHALITGGCGFIGSHLADALIDRGCRVTVLDNLTTGHRSNLAHLGERVTVISGDIRDRQALDRAMAGCDVVFHEAAVVSVVETVNDPLESAQVNDMGTLQVLESARQQGIRRVVLASSAAVYGDEAPVPNSESMQPRPQSPYAVQKHVGELYASVYGKLYGSDVVCLRYFNVYGPRQDPSSPYSGVISIFMAKAARKERPTIYGDGKQYRDFVYVADVVQANLLAAQAPAAGGQCLNIGTGRRVTINDLWRMIAALAGCQAAAAYRPFRPGDIRASVPDIDRARSVLDYRPAYGLEQGLSLTLDWYRK